MSYVQDYSRDPSGKTNLYDVKVCKHGWANCQILTGQYMFKNDVPARQFFPFPATPDNVLFFVDDRVLQDPRAVSTFIIPHAVAQECFKIDPCDIYASSYCCSANKQSEQTKKTQDTLTELNKDTKISTATFVLFIVVMCLAMIAFLGLTLVAVKIFPK